MSTGYLSVFVTLTLLVVASRATPIPTTTVASPSTYTLYTLLISDADALRTKFLAVYNSFKTSRFSTSDVRSPDMDIPGFLTTDDLPSNRFFMTESELLPRHQEFMQTYEKVMVELKQEEVTVIGSDSEFVGEYDDVLVLIARVLNKLQELMDQQSITNGNGTSFTDLQWVPNNEQVHNVRSAYILQSINDYLPVSLQEYNMLRSKSTQ